MDDVLQTKLLNEYYGNEAKKLHNIIDKILHKFHSTVGALKISNKDIDDFYSIGNSVFSDVLNKYEPNQDFEGYLYRAIENKIKSEFTRRNAKSRCSDKDIVSLDDDINSETEHCFYEMMADEYNLEEDIVLRCDGDILSPKIQAIFDSLSKLKKRIILLLMRETTVVNICKELNIKPSQYCSEIKEIRAIFNRKEALVVKEIKCKPNINNNNSINSSKGDIQMTIENTLENWKSVGYSTASYIKQLKKFEIRDDHPLQRYSDQWRLDMKYSLISAILNNDPFPSVILAEQIINSSVIVWLIDGKQRLTTIKSFRNNEFKLGRNIDRPFINYHVVSTDEKGNHICDDRGNPVYTQIQFDMRNKYFKDLPEELQDKFDDYSIGATKFLHCTDEDIEYHIRRYNNAKTMTAAQKGITHLGSQFARVAKSLSSLQFFKDKGRYTSAERNNGTLDRIVIESIMAINFLSKWKKRQEDMCNFLKDNAKVNHFNNLEELLNRLNDIFDDESDTEHFNSKETTLFMACFNNFTKLNIDDSRFLDFIREFNTTLCDKEVDGVSYNMLSEHGKATKDKKSITDRINCLTELMYDYLDINIEETHTNEFNNELINQLAIEISDIDIVADNSASDEEIILLGTKILMQLSNKANDTLDDFANKFNDTEKLEDVAFYLQALSDWTVNVDNNSKVLDINNLPSLVGLVEYVYKNDLDESLAIQWLGHYVDNYNGEEITFELLNKKLNQYIDYKLMMSESTDESIETA